MSRFVQHEEKTACIGTHRRWLMQVEEFNLLGFEHLEVHSLHLVIDPCANGTILHLES